MSEEHKGLAASCLSYAILRNLLQVIVCLALLSSSKGVFAGDSRGGEDPELMLQRIRDRLAAHLSQLHNYTCHVAIDRLVQDLNPSRLDQRDRAEFDVAFLGDRELFSKPGETRFEDQSINRVVKMGMIGNDILGSHDDDLFSSDVATLKYAGSCQKDGHKTFRYNFSVPQTSSRLFISQVNSGAAVVGYQGSFWVDSETLDLVRLEWKADHIPTSVGISSVKKSMHYKVMRVGNSDFLLPIHSELTSFDHAGRYRLNVVSLERCLEYTGQSVVTFGKPVQEQRHDATRPEP
jgi:hypothetical protein